ncbi:hypothetical protein B0H13DRAFT_2308148 [Mycena leptocephala]|nr:hypothetical protein B0H13DRAFT_2308148 [Mycena leptocephala]
MYLCPTLSFAPAPLASLSIQASVAARAVSMRDLCSSPSKDVLRTSLLALKESADAFPPLKSAVSGVIAVWDIAEHAKNSKADALDIAHRTQAILDVVADAVPDATMIASPMLQNFIAASALRLEVKYECIDSRLVALDANVGKLTEVAEWDGKSFHRCSMKALELRIQLGHPLGEQCPNPEKAVGDDFVIVNTHTINEVGLDFCNCTKAKTIQLLRMRVLRAFGRGAS